MSTYFILAINSSIVVVLPSKIAMFLEVQTEYTMTARARQNSLPRAPEEFLDLMIYPWISEGRL